MKIRLEAAKTPATTWRWFLRLAKRQPGYSFELQDDLEVHSVEFTALRDFAALFDVVRNWKTVSVYLDDKLLTRAEAWSLYMRDRRQDAAIDALTNALRASARRPRNEEP